MKTKIIGMSYFPGTRFIFNNKPPQQERHFWAVPGTYVRFVKVRFLDDGEQPISLKVNGLALA